MDKFGYGSDKGYPYSDTDDRYGFSRDTESISRGSFRFDPNLDPKPHFKITVSSTGNVRQNILPPIPSRHSHFDRPITLRELQAALDSKQMEKYGSLSRDFLSALSHQLPLASKRLDYKPFFLGFESGLRDTATWDQGQFSLRLDITDQVKAETAVIIIPFGDQPGHLDSGLVTLTIQDQDDKFIGYAYGTVMCHDNITRITIGESFNSGNDKLEWAQIPSGSCLKLILSLDSNEEILPQENVDEKINVGAS